MPHTQAHAHKITPQEALQRTIEHREIFHDEMLHLMRLIMSGEMSPVMMAAFITGLRVKKETIGEITAAAQGCASSPQGARPTNEPGRHRGTGGDGSQPSPFDLSMSGPPQRARDRHGGRSVSARAAVRWLESLAST